MFRNPWLVFNFSAYKWDSALTLSETAEWWAARGCIRCADCLVRPHSWSPPGSHSGSKESLTWCVNDCWCSSKYPEPLGCRKRPDCFSGTRTRTVCLGSTQLLAWSRPDCKDFRRRDCLQEESLLSLPLAALASERFRLAARHRTYSPGSCTGCAGRYPPHTSPCCGRTPFRILVSSAGVSSWSLWRRSTPWASPSNWVWP